MIVKVVHIYTANGGDFTDKLRSEIAKMQNECGLDVEVQYQTARLKMDITNMLSIRLLLLEERKAVRGDG